VAYYANELSINEMKPGDWLVCPCPHVTPTDVFPIAPVHPVIYVCGQTDRLTDDATRSTTSTYVALRRGLTMIMLV